MKTTIFLILLFIPATTDRQDPPPELTIIEQAQAIRADLQYIKTNINNQ